MNYKLILTRLFFKLASVVAPTIAVNIAFELFQRTKKKVRAKEQDFFVTAKHFQVPGKAENIDCYELGNPKGEIVFLIHGWESNAGSMSAIADKLASLNYRVIAFNLPAHGSSNLKKANLLSCSYAFLMVLGHIKPKGKFSVISHSFGSAVASYTFSKVRYDLNKLVFLTTPNSLVSIFNDFRKLIGLGDSAFKLFLQKAEALLGEDPNNASVETIIKDVKYSEMVVMHDLFDKVISHQNSLLVHNAAPKSRLVTTIGVGHYGMLWDEKVLNQIDEFFRTEKFALPNAS